MASLTSSQTITTSKATTNARQQSQTQPRPQHLHHHHHHHHSTSIDSQNNNPSAESVVFDAAQATTTTNWNKLSPTNRRLNQLRFTEDALYIDHKHQNDDDPWCGSPISRTIPSNNNHIISPNSTSACNSTTELYNKISPVGSFDFKPEESDFSVMQELWIRKDWADISIRIAFVAPIVLLGILGNLTIIYSICKFKNFRSKPTNIFILNMAIADLLTTMVCPIAALVKDIYQFYVLGSFICRFEGFVKITCLLVSSYSLIVLSLDWLLCVIKPCRTRISIKHSWLALTTVWITSVLMASPLFVWRKLRHRQWRDFVETWCCELIQYTKYYWVGITFFLIYLPTFIMIIVFVIILAQMDKFEAKLRRSCDTQGSHSLSINIKYRRRIVKIIFAYLLTSIICWTPLQFTVIYRHFRSEPTFSPWFSELAFFAQLSASLTAVMNPIIFGFLSQPFRRLVTKSFMLKFLDKIVTTHNGSPVIGGDGRNGDRNQILVMNQRANRNNNNKNGKNQSDYRTSDRLDMQRVNLKQISSNPTSRGVLSHQKIRMNSRSNNQQVMAIDSLTTNGERSSQNNNNHIDTNKRVSFHSSVISASSMKNQLNNDVVRPKNCQPSVAGIGGYDNRAYKTDNRINIDMNTKGKEEVDNIYTNNQQRRPSCTTTTSFIQPDRQLLGLSLVSMDSINIEESIAEIVDEENVEACTFDYRK